MQKLGRKSKKFVQKKKTIFSISIPKHFIRNHETNCSNFREDAFRLLEYPPEKKSANQVEFANFSILFSLVQAFEKVNKLSTESSRAFQSERKMLKGVKLE